MLLSLPADKNFDSRQTRSLLKSPKLRFATDVELNKMAFVEKGALPPFGGGVIYPFAHYCHTDLLKNPYVVFNRGVTTRSLKIKMEDYLCLVNPMWTQRV